MLPLLYFSNASVEENKKTLQIIFPKPVRRLRANPEYIERARSKAHIGNLTGKAESLGRATIAVPNAMRLKG
jgi:hypothetical protein